MNGNDNSAAPCLRVAVGSANPCKIDAVHQALRKCLDRKEKNRDMTLAIEGYPVESGVESQPFGDAVTSQGAQNRALAAYLEYEKKHGHYPHLSVGMEGGVEWVGGVNGDHKMLYCMAWMAVYGKRQGFTVDAFASDETASYYGDKKPYCSLGKTASFPIPPQLTKLIVQDGMELGEADDLLFKRQNSKQGSGSVGLLTDGVIDRAAYYEHAIVLALTPWIRPDVYPQETTTNS